MSWDGTVIGRPLAGERTLLTESMSTRASSWASTESGMWTAIWSPSKSAFKAAHTSGRDRMLFDHLFENVPDFRPLALDHFLGALDGGGKPLFLKLVEDEGLEELECHLLRQTALVELEVRADDDHRTARVVHAFAEEVLTEPSLLALEHVREG